MDKERGIGNVTCLFQTIVQICDSLWGEVTIGNKGETTDVEKNCVSSLVIFDDYFFVFIWILFYEIVVSVKEILQEVLFGVCGVYFSWSSVSVYSFKFEEYVWVDAIFDLSLIHI